MAAVAPTPVLDAAARQAPRRRWITPARVFFVCVAILIYLGWRIPTERYITPRSGLGYALGITGGSMMVFLLLYSARKRVRWLRWMGSVTRWFEVHMVLGVLGPLCILFHSNFSLGATNSNVAFFSMLTVAGSGLVGRYLYSHIHFGLYGRKKTLADLKSSAERLHSLGQSVPFLPQLMARLDAAVSVRVVLSRWSLRRHVRRTLRQAARQSPPIANERRRLQRAAYGLITQRLRAARNVAEFEVYQRLFGLWHVLHLPLIFMLFIAGIVHVIAVHVY